MKNYHFFVIGLCLLLSSCSLAITYIGDKATPPTTSVDIFYSIHDVSRQFKVMGHMTYPYSGDQDFIKKQLTNFAKKIGADAIVITGNTVANSGRNSSDVVNADAIKYTN